MTTPTAYAPTRPTTATYPVGHPAWRTSKRHANKRDWQRFCDDVGHPNLRTQKRYAQRVRTDEGEMSNGTPRWLGYVDGNRVPIAEESRTPTIMRTPERKGRTLKQAKRASYIERVKALNEKKRDAMRRYAAGGRMTDSELRRELKRVSL